MQSLPETVEACARWCWRRCAERDAAVSERDALLAQNDRLRHLLLKLTAHAVRRQIRASAGGATAARPGGARAGDRQGRGRGGEADPELRKDSAAKRRASRGALPGASAADRGDAGARGHRLPMLPGDDDGDRRGHLRTARRDPGAVSGDRDAAAETRLPGLPGHGGADARAAAADRRRHSRPRRWSPMCWSRAMPTICRCIARRRSWRGRA